MAIYWWKGTSAIVPVVGDSSTHTAWINATSAGLSANWVCSQGSNQAILGATLLPGANDSVIITDYYLYHPGHAAGQGPYPPLPLPTLSPCLNSSGAGITCANSRLGPFGVVFNNTNGLSYGPASCIVGGPLGGNEASIRFAGIKGTTLSGYPLNIRHTTGCCAADSGLAPFTLYLKPIGGTTAGFAVINTGDTGPFTDIQRPWVKTIQILGGSSKSLLFDKGVLLHDLLIDGYHEVTPGTTANAAWFYSEIQSMRHTGNTGGAQNNIPKMVISPYHRRTNTVAANYVLENNFTGYAGSPQYEPSLAGLIIKNAQWYPGISQSTELILGPKIYLGAHERNIGEPGYGTSHNFSTIGFGSNYGSPSIFLSGTVTIPDFHMTTGTLDLDPNSWPGQYGVIGLNGKISGLAKANYGGMIGMLSGWPTGDSVPGAGASIHLPGSGSYGLRVTNGIYWTELVDAVGASVTYPVGAVLATHTTSIYPA